MREFSESAWQIASLYSYALASETRDLAAHIDIALAKERAKNINIRDADVITGAMAIAQARGHDPDEAAPLSEMCTEDNAPVPWWKVFEEEAEACLRAVRDQKIKNS